MSYMEVCCAIHGGALYHTWRCLVSYIEVCCAVHGDVVPYKDGVWCLT